MADRASRIVHHATMCDVMRPCMPPHVVGAHAVGPCMHARPRISASPDATLVYGMP